VGCIYRITCPLLHIYLLCVSIQFLLFLVPLWLYEEDWSFCTPSLPFLCAVAVFFYCSNVVMLLCFLYLQWAKVLLGEERSGESSLHALLLQSSILSHLQPVLFCLHRFGWCCSLRVQGLIPRTQGPWNGAMNLHGAWVWQWLVGMFIDALHSQCASTTCLRCHPM